MKRAIYAFSGDPITFGHIDIIKRAAHVFDELIVAIGNNPNKDYLFSQEERTEMAIRSLSFLKNVKVKAFDGMLVDFAYENNVDVIVKGVRSEKDFQYEQNLYLMGDSQNLKIDTFVLFARPELAHVSSSAVKEIQEEQGFLDGYVPLYVKQCLEERIGGRYVVGLTGEIGVGKSFVGDKLVALAKEKGIEAHNIELDKISHQIQSELKEEKYALLRQEIIDTFGEEVVEDGKINRKVLGEIVFNDKAKLIKLNEIMHTAILLRLRKELKNKKGLVFINAALLAEAEMATFANNNMVIIKADDKVQERRLLERGLDKEQIKRRLKSQYNFSNKKKNLEMVIKERGHGKIWIYDNSKDEINSLDLLLEDLLKYFKISNQ